MDPKIIEQVSVKIAENLNSISDSVRAVSEKVLDQYASAQYTFGFIFMGLGVLSLLVSVSCGILACKVGTKNEDTIGKFVILVIATVLTAIPSLAFVSECLQSFYFAMSPITVLLLGK